MSEQKQSLNYVLQGPVGLPLENVPVYVLLGGKYRDKIRLYADCHAGETDEPQTYAEKALAVVQEGYSAVKFDVDKTGMNKLDPYN